MGLGAGQALGGVSLLPIGPGGRGLAGQ